MFKLFIRNGVPRLPGDVTLPHDTRFIDWVAVVYSYIPFVIPLLVFCELLITRGTRQLSILLFTGMTTLANELLVKPFCALPRPGALGPAPGVLTNSLGEHAGSCNTSCGMPSSHSTMAIGFLMLTMFDGIIRVKPDTFLLSQEEVEMQQTLREMISVTPLAPKRVMGNTEFLGFFFTWMILLGPVPMMRVVLRDHTAVQVCVGGLLGAARELGESSEKALFWNSCSGPLSCPVMCSVRSVLAPFVAMPGAPFVASILPVYVNKKRNV
ncbi:unnamed protein product [Durusdinium trenchii]|uniref:Dolichyldiphosphatase n=1 Tax=Durusdinium trenchii TaxID=1381693 RepID=A0ABP0QE59_9DINO